MKQELEFRNFEPTGEVRKLIESRIAHLDRKAQGLRPDPLFLRCAVEELPTRKLFHVSLTLDVPEKTLAANVQMHDIDAAIRSAFQEIEEQLEAYKSGRRGEQWWKRIDRRREIKRLKVGAASEVGGERPQ